MQTELQNSTDGALHKCIWEENFDEENPKNMFYEQILYV